jgi:hypothetical protein
MHVINGAHKPDPPDDRTFKLWGFWNSRADRMGNPPDRRPRPWFYTWSLMSRLFPNGSTIVESATEPSMRRFRCLAGTHVDHGHTYTSVMLVNDYDESRYVRVHIPGVNATSAVTEYRYFEDDDRPVDAKGLATPSLEKIHADATGNVTVYMPTRGVVFVSTVN